MERDLETVRSRKLAEWYEILKSGHCMVRRIVIVLHTSLVLVIGVVFRLQ